MRRDRLALLVCLFVVSGCALGGPSRHPPLLPSFTLASFAFAGGFAGEQVLGCNRIFWQWKNWESGILSQVKTEATGRSIVSIAQSERADRMASEFIAILEHSQYKQSWVVGRQVSEVLLRDTTQGGYEYGISCHYGALSPFTYRPILFISSPGREPIVRVRQDDPGLLLAALAQETDHCSPGKLRWQSPTVLKIDKKFRVLVRVFRDHEVSNHPIFPADGYIRPLTHLQRVLHRFPLLLGVLHVDESEHDNCHGCECGYGSVVFIQEADDRYESSRNKAPHCYDHAHPVLAILIGIVGVLLLVIGAGSCGTGENCSAIRAILSFLGIIVCAVGLWLIYQAFGLAIFKVAPCA